MNEEIEYNINQNLVRRFQNENPTVVVDFINNEDIKVILNNVNDYLLFKNKLNAYRYNKERKRIKSKNIYKFKFGRLTNQLHLEQVLIQKSTDVKIILLDMFIKEFYNDDRLININCLIDKYGIIIYKNHYENIISISFSKSVPFTYYISYIKIKNNNREVFGMKNGEALPFRNRVKRSLSNESIPKLTSFQNNLNEIQEIGGKISTSLTGIESERKIKNNIVVFTPVIEAKLLY